MQGTSRNLLGCLVTDVQTGASIGWVQNTVFDATGEQITELLVDPSARRTAESARNEERGERLIGHPLVDSTSRYLGEIVDVVVGTESGQVQGLMIERTPGQADYMPIYQGILWEHGHWVLMQDTPRLRSTMFPAEEEPPATAEVSEDWMVGQIARVRLTDRQGQVIIEPGQRITLQTVEHASRAGVLHRLDAEFPEEVT